ncbi:hypothetical protein TWF694_005362 [Orbilia ellipsospora]|uniref:Uncharacterized protein n=1 Tax=Orbilia ellipsospora TaxID=2528407 RepID=A0AAV9WSW1_9PEZI
MWYFAKVPLEIMLWFSDGQPISNTRGGNSSSSRLIAGSLGFLDITEVMVENRASFFDFNGAFMLANQTNTNWDLEQRDDKNVTNIQNEGKEAVPLYLEIDTTTKNFIVGVYDVVNQAPKKCNKTIDTVLISYNSRLTDCAPGLFKALPAIDPEDAKFLDTMIQEKRVPYQNIPESPGKPEDEIRRLGKQYFPFSPYSFQLAMSVYDWTTASFARLVFFKIFQYTSIQSNPYPLDLASIAKAIYSSNWPPYTPNNTDYMNSFLMKPASSLEDVQNQLSKVVDRLYRFSEVENRLLAAAVQSLPRTSIFQHREFFSGQIDISQLGSDVFGIELLESPLNNGPVGVPLTDSFRTAISSYASVGETITTKMVWSFTDSAEDAMHYSNGILLTVYAPPIAVWESLHFITPLSDDPAKTEYIFPPGSKFRVLSIDQVRHSDKDIVGISLMPVLQDESMTAFQSLPSWILNRLDLNSTASKSF